MRSVEHLRPDWCPALPSRVGSFDTWQGRMRCPWCEAWSDVDDEDDWNAIDGCPACGRAVIVRDGGGDDKDDGLDVFDAAEIVAVRTEADARYLHWRQHRLLNLTLGVPSPDWLTYQLPRDQP